MDVTSEMLDGFEFRKKGRGYDADQVDELISAAGATLGDLETRVAEASDRADRAEARAEEAESRAKSSSESDETIQRTLLLAQRTADAAVQEAEETAAKKVGDAESEAKRLIEEADEARSRALANAEEEVRRSVDESRMRLEQEIASLEQIRDALMGDVETLEEHIEVERARLRASSDALTDMLSRTDRLGQVEMPELSEVDTGSVGSGPDSDAGVTVDDDGSPPSVESVLSVDDDAAPADPMLSPDDDREPAVDPVLGAEDDAASAMEPVLPADEDAVPGVESASSIDEVPPEAGSVGSIDGDAAALEWSPDGSDAPSPAPPISDLMADPGDEGGGHPGDAMDSIDAPPPPPPPPPSFDEGALDIAPEEAPPPPPAPPIGDEPAAVDDDAGSAPEPPSGGFGGLDGAPNDPDASSPDDNAWLAELTDEDGEAESSGGRRRFGRRR